MWVENPSGDVMFAVQGNGNLYSIGGGYINNLTIGKDCSILGMLKANQIQGELVVARTYSNADAVSKGGWASFGTIQVVTSEPFDRTLEAQVNLRVESSRTGINDSGDVWAKGYARMTGSFGTVQSDVLSSPPDYHSAGGTTTSRAERMISLMILVPANTKGTMTLQVMLSDSRGKTSEARMSGTGGSKWIGRIFRNGTGLA
ncbi:hypothetical protein KW452_02280 [Vibrio fluvialis]|nr:hypothetical protein [Vibrio fluvialis]